jgi:tetratricopeptide (TPR) repeat protein
MNKENVLFSIVGLLLGFIIGFMFANSANQRGGGTASTTTTMPITQQNPNLPADHPAIPGSNQQGAAIAEVQAAIKLAKDQPDNYDAQMKAAEAYYRIQRFDDAIEFLKRANQIRPDAYEPLVNLGNAYFDSDRFEEAEKWYAQALAKKPDDVNVRTDLGLTFFFRRPPDVDRAIKEYRASLERNPNHPQTLQNLTVALIKKGDAAEAEKILARLEQANPANPALAQLRSDLQALRSSSGGSQTSNANNANKSKK